MSKTSTQQRLIYCFAAAVVIGIVITTTLAYLRSHAGQLAPLKSMKSWQHADVPLGYTLDDGNTAVFDPRFLQLTAFDRALLPSAPTMSWPMGSRHGALTYNAQPFWADNKQRGGHHTGDDINGIGGMNTDLGDPVYAVANGLVIYRGEPAPGWGNTIILAHRSPDGSVYQHMYAHLQKSYAALGELVSIGEKIGTVGTANLNYPAHLHFEFRHSSGVWIGSGYVNGPTEHLDPASEFGRFSNKPPDLLHTEPLAVVKRERLQKAREGILINNSTK